MSLRALAIILVFVAGFAVAVAFGAGTEPPGLSSALRGSARTPSTFVNARVLAANTAETVTAPTFASFPSARAIGVFSASCSNWYYNVTATASVPAADVTDGGASGRGPVALVMAQGATLSIVADATCVVTTEWYVEREP
jgi:hypothetical protein